MSATVTSAADAAAAARRPARFVCKLCRGTRVRSTYRLAAELPYLAVVCAECGLFQDLYDWAAAPKFEATTALDTDAEDWVSEREMEAHAHKAETFSALLERAGLLRGASVLDIGCGEGHFLHACQQRGAGRVTGQEFQMRAVRYASERFGLIDLRTVPLDDRAVWPDAEFDLVCSFDVLEHVHDLQTLFEQCLRVLKPGGTLFHATPGADSITHRLGRVLSRMGVPRLAGTLTNVQYVDNLLGGPHVHLLGRRQMEWVAKRYGLTLRTEYAGSYSYSDQHYAAVLPQLRPLPRPLGVLVFQLARNLVRNKLVFWARKNGPAQP